MFNEEAYNLRMERLNDRLTRVIRAKTELEKKRAALWEYRIIGGLKEPIANLDSQIEKLNTELSHWREKMDDLYQLRAIFGDEE